MSHSRAAFTVFLMISLACSLDEYEVQAERVGPCRGITCSGHGTCDDSTGVAVCSCTEGFRPEGTACVEALLEISPSTVTVAVTNAVDFEAIGGTPPYEFSVANGSGTIDAATGEYTAPATPGVDTVRVTDASADTADATVTVNAALAVTPAETVVELDGTTTFTGTGGVVPYAWSLASGVGSIDAITGVYTAPTSPGSAVVRLTDAYDNTADAGVTVTDDLSITPSEVMLAVDNQEDFDASGGVPPYGFSVVSGGGSVDAATGLYTAPPTAGAASVQVEDADGATVEASVTINPALAITPTTATVAIDHGITFAASGGVPPWTFSVTAGSGTVDPASGAYLASSTPETSSTVRVTDVRGNVADATVQVTLPEVTKNVGPGGDFPTMQAWEDARDGDLTGRVVLEVSGVTGTFIDDETVTGSSCSGAYVPENDAGSTGTRLTLDGTTTPCAAGDTLTGSSSAATASVVAELLGPGAIEVMAIAAGTYDEHLVLAGATTDVDHYMKITAAPGARHHGTAGSGVVIDPSTTGHVLQIESDWTVVEWIEITGWENANTDNSWEAVSVAADGVTLRYLLLHDDNITIDNPNSDAINLNGMMDGWSIDILNTVIYNIGRGGILRQDERVVTSPIVVNITGCTIFNTALSGNDADGAGAITNNNANVDMRVVNTLAMDSCSDPTRTCTTNLVVDFSNVDSWGPSATNLSSDGTAPGAGSLTDLASDDQFVSTSAGAEDLHLKAGADALEVGTPAPTETPIDIDGETRPRGSGWDIGADER